MKTPLPGFLAASFIFQACTGADSQQAFEAALVVGTFAYDVSSLPGFSPAPRFRMHGDTAEIHDYFALAQQAQLTAGVSVKGDTLMLVYPVSGGQVNEWMPTAEASLKVVLKGAPGSIHLRLPQVEGGRTATSNETGFRDGDRPQIVKVDL